MTNNLDNGTLTELVKQLQTLNRNLSMGNSIGNDNRSSFSNISHRGSKVLELDEEKRIKGDIRKYENMLNRKNLKDETRKKYEAHLKDSKREMADFKASQMAPVVGKITKGIESVVNIGVALFEGKLRRQTIKLEAASEMQSRAIQTYGKSLNNAIGVQVQNVTGTVLDTAYNSLNAVLEGGRTFYMKGLADVITQRRKENEIYKSNVEEAAGVVDGVAGLVSMIPGPIGLIGSALGAMASMGKKAAMLEAEKTELRIKLSEESMKLQDQFLQQTESVVKQFADMSKQVSKAFMEAGNAVYTYGRTLGISSDYLERYQQSVINGVNIRLAKFGMDYKDYFKMQGAYNAASGGRTPIIATGEAEMMAGLSKRVNLATDEIASITGGMNVFNIGISEGTEMIYEMSKIANRMGLNATKFTKDMEKNLKLAEKYQFKGGIKGMMEMALWAQKTRFNLESLSSLQEKMLSGNIEDVIQTSARLNVLGGNAALYSDPMAMLYNGLVNPEELAKNINRMIAGYGTFNNRTGETTFSANEMLRMQQIAQINGMSREELMNQARQANKSEVIKRRYGKKFLNNIEGVTQHATWSEEKGDFIIKVNAPHRAEGFEEVRLSDLNGDNDSRLQQIFPEDKQDRLIDYVQDIRNFLSPEEYQKYADNYATAQVMSESSKKGLAQTMIDMASGKIVATDVNLSENAEMVVNFAQAALDAQRKMNQFIGEGNASDLVTSYLKFTGAQNEELLKETKKFVTSGDSIQKKLDEITRAIYEAAGEELPKKETKSASDAIITPNGVVNTDPNDMIAAFKPGGPIAQGLGTNNSLPQNPSISRIEVSGTLRLDTGSQSVDLIELVKNDPQFFRQLTENVLTEASKNKYGGRPMGTPTHNTI